MSGNSNPLNNSGISSVLITGGSGLIGRYLTSALLAEGYNVSHLSRKANQVGRVRVHRWDPGKGILDKSALEGIDCIIHLAGANIGEKRWTSIRKKEILSSRVDSANLLLKTVNENNIKLQSFISASAVGYYGSVTSEKIFTEEDPPSSDFLGTVCRQWEECADAFVSTGARVVKIRTGVVIEKNDSALSKIMIPAKLGFLVKTGNGKQFMPWIHITDLVKIYLLAIRNAALAGTFNAVSPVHLTHSEFMLALGKVIQKPVFPISVPGLILKMALGQMSDVVLKGSRVSSVKIIKSGYNFQFSEPEAALINALF